MRTGVDPDTGLRFHISWDGSDGPHEWYTVSVSLGRRTTVEEIRQAEQVAYRVLKDHREQMMVYPERTRVEVQSEPYAGATGMLVIVEGKWRDPIAGTE